MTWITLPRDYDYVLVREGGILPLHTSDRQTFKRCRRRWSLASPLGRHLTRKDSDRASLWFGTGFHFSLEDYHGYNRFGDPIDALLAYRAAFNGELSAKLPVEADDLVELGIGMLDHYKNWLKRRDHYKTLWINGQPQVEVRFRIPLPWLSEQFGKPVAYQGTFDRVCLDEHGRLWIKDYKTAASFDTGKLETDPQISSYLWAAEQLYPEYQVEGVIFMQHLKAFPIPPEPLVKGGYSVDKRQRTTHAMYRETLISAYGSVQKAPSKNIEFLNSLLDDEGEHYDRFIRRDLVRRNEAFRYNEGVKINYEGYDMLNDDLIMYPNPTRDCSWDCDFRSVCLAMDDGSDWESMLEAEFEEKGEEPEWQSKIKWPEMAV